MWQRLRQTIEKYERHLSSVALIIGFIIDNLTFQRVDLLLDNLILIFYMVVAALAIMIRNFYHHEVLRGKVFGWGYTASPLVLQFAFGGLFSGFVVLYARSASFLASWPFLLMLAGLLVGNEFFRTRYAQLTFQVSMLFVGIFSFMIFAVPVVLRTMGDWVFLLSGAASLLIIGLFVRFLAWAIPGRIQQTKHALVASILGIFLGINLLYFGNIIPPIPLSLKDAGIYHAIVRSSSGYTVHTEEQPWWISWWGSPTLHITRGQVLYAYSAVFAPTQLHTQIFHEWQFYNETERRWVIASRVSFPIVGGRNEGYRGYSLHTRLFPGKWRVSIENKRGQRIGRVSFFIEQVSQAPLLYNKTL